MYTEDKILIWQTNYATQIARAFAESKAFFELPSSTKCKYAKDVTKGFHGWAQPNQEK
jgi:isopenicillin N synthase-like dioxygenase